MIATEFCMQAIWEEAFTISHAIWMDVFSCNSCWMDRKSLKTCARVPSTSSRYWNYIRNSVFYFKIKNKLQVLWSEKNILSTWSWCNQYLIARKTFPFQHWSTNFKIHSLRGRREVTFANSGPR